MDTDEQLEFFDRIWGQNEGHVQFVQKALDDQGKRTGAPTDDKWFEWPLERARIGRYISSRSDEDLYFAVPMYKGDERHKTQVKFLTCAFADDDGVTEEFLEEPSITVQSSPGHRHHYWIYDQPHGYEAEYVGREIAEYHRHDNSEHETILEGDRDRMQWDKSHREHKFCGTDPGGWDLTQILRVPGSINTKPGNDNHRATVHYTGAVYTLEEMWASYPLTVQVPSAGELILTDLPDNLPDNAGLITRLGSRSDLIDLYINTPTGIGNSQGWDERLFALENELFRMGFSAEEVYVVAWHSACNKFQRGVRRSDGKGFDPRPDPQGDLWRDVLKAQAMHAQVASTHMGVDYDRNAVFAFPEKTEDGTVEAVVHRPFEVSILSDDERVVVADTYTFVNRYLDWATKKTDAAPVFHIASAFTILSVVFGELGHAQTAFGKIRLNLWFLVLGKTTRSRKSTSRRIMLSIIKGLSDPEHQYDEGSDFTPEALNSVLAEKPRRSSLVHRDEVQGMFKEIASKNYMSAVNDTLTDLYDGETRKVLRKGGSSDSAETNFVLFLMGIVGKVTSQLRLDDFESGFLARFIHVIGEPPPRTRESEWLDQATASQAARGDQDYIAMLRAIMGPRAHYERLVQDHHTVPVEFEEDAWRRWNEANWDMQELVKDHDRGEVLEAAVDRLGKSCIKAAILLAMYDMSPKVQMKHVLSAIHYTEGWLRGTVRSAEMVSESFFKKDMNDLHTLIIKEGGGITWERAYSKMDKKPQEFAQVVEGLILSGRARMTVIEPSKQRVLEMVA